MILSLHQKYKKNKSLQNAGKVITIVSLCQFAEVSQSGYYKWLNSSELRQQRIENEFADLELIKTIFFDNEETIGYRTIVLQLLDNHGIIMNAKKVARLMKKYHLICKIRKNKSYGNTFNQQRIENTFENLLKTTFDCKEPSTVFHTDITYIKYAHGTKTAYLSAVKDQATREIAAYTISNTLELPFVMDTLDQLRELQLNDQAIIHSDQGTHYTSNGYKDKIYKLGLTGSMSRRGKCVDNAPIETFFGHMKDEINFNRIGTYEELVERLNKYVYNYNNHRRQWTLKKMTPIAYRNHLLMNNSAA